MVEKTTWFLSSAKSKKLFVVSEPEPSYNQTNDQTHKVTISAFASSTAIFSAVLPSRSTVSTSTRRFNNWHVTPVWLWRTA